MVITPQGIIEVLPRPDSGLDQTPGTNQSKANLLSTMDWAYYVIDIKPLAHGPANNGPMTVKPQIHQATPNETFLTLSLILCY